MSEKKLVKIEDLYKGDLAVISQRNQLNILLNQEPKDEWLKDHPLVTGVRYLPIGKVEFLLTAIFQEWRVEVKNIVVIANSVVVTICLHYKNPIDDAWSWTDGAGAAVIQTSSGAGAMEWDKVNSMAVMQAVPAAESYAIKDAAEKLGKIFGKDINRKEGNDYNILQHKFKHDERIITLKVKLSELISHCQDIEITEPIIEETLKAEKDDTADVEFYSKMIAKLDNHE